MPQRIMSPAAGERLVRFVGDQLTFTLRAARLWEIVPGQIATVKVAKRWTYSGQAYLSGTIESKRLDAARRQSSRPRTAPSQ